MARKHAHEGPARAVRVHLVTVSTSRSAATDESGPLMRELVEAHGHAVSGTSLVPDDPDDIGALLDRLAGEDAEAIVLSGGTGVSARDCTPAVLRSRLDRELPGFGELFRMLSFQEIGSAAMLSRAVAGIIADKVVFSMPGSSGAVKLAMNQLILPELGHVVRELRKTGSN